MSPRLIRLHPDRDDFAMYLSGRRGPFGTSGTWCEACRAERAEGREGDDYA